MVVGDNINALTPWIPPLKEVETNRVEYKVLQILMSLWEKIVLFVPASGEQQ